MGRKPKPRALKIIEGNPGRRPIGTEPPVAKGVPDCPDHLDGDAAKEWARIAPELAQAGLLAHVDRAALAAYCQAWGRWVGAERLLKTHGMIVKSPNGHLIQSPVLPIANKAMAQMLKFLTEFGMTPSSRARLDVDWSGDGEDASPLSKYVRAR